MSSIFFLTLIVLIMLSVAFFTLIERKILGLSQARKGPNKTFSMGVFQPISDVLKLLKKEWIKPKNSNVLGFVLFPMLTLAVSMVSWGLMPSMCPSYYTVMTTLLLMALLSVSIFPLTMSGWTSNSKYCLIGAMRALAQIISYEISLALSLMGPLLFFCTFLLVEISFFSNMSWFIMFMPATCTILLVSSLAEIHRTPFDLVEGESELVSGFNVEYSGLGFTVLFLSEYMSLLMMSVFVAILLFSTSGWGMEEGLLIFIFKVCTISLMYIMIRATFPRIRYDKLMSLAWHFFLPLSICFLVLITPITVLMN